MIPKRFGDENAYLLRFSPSSLHPSLSCFAALLCFFIFHSIATLGTDKFDCFAPRCGVAPPTHSQRRAQRHCRFFLKNSREDSWNSSYVDSLSQHSFILAFASSCYTRVKVLDIIHTGIFQCLIDSFTPPNTLSFVSCCFFLVAIKRLVGN